MIEQNTVRTFYKKLLTLYPKTFKERLAESMEQTFNDLCTEKRETKQNFLRFVILTFAETTMGIVHEHILLIQEMYMKVFLTNISSSVLISFLFILPFMIMEVVNRRNFNNDFPFMLFFGLWLNLFIISIILVPIVLARQTGKHDTANPAPTQGNTLHINSKSVVMISVVLVLSLVTVSLLDSQHLVNNPNAEQLSVFGIRVPSQFIALVLFSLPIAAGIIAGGPIVRTLRTGGSLFAHPINLIIVVLILSTFTIGLVSLIIDQWSCFMGVPNCD